MLGLAVGTKLWPVMLAPLLLRPLRDRPLEWLGGIALLVAIIAAFSAPIYWGGLDSSSGFVAYGESWKTNSALFPALEGAAHGFLDAFGLAADNAGRLVRSALAVFVFLLALWLARPPIALVLVSPAQYPWYMTWLIPFLAFQPVVGLLAVTATVPIYYASFHFHAMSAYPVYRDVVVWLIWLPVWLMTVTHLVRQGGVRKLTAGSR
jgi:hypothetical protein